MNENSKSPKGRQNREFDYDEYVKTKYSGRWKRRITEYYLWLFFCGVLIPTFLILYIVLMLLEFGLHLLSIVSIVVSGGLSIFLFWGTWSKNGLRNGLTWWKTAVIQEDKFYDDYARQGLY